MPGRPFRKRKLQKFRTAKELLESSDYVDYGEMDVVAGLREIPLKDTCHKPHESEERKFGCLPWVLQLTREEKRREGTECTNFIRVALKCTHQELESEWIAKASGVLSMEKWPEKVKHLACDDEKKTKYYEKFARKFNANQPTHPFIMCFPVPTRRGGSNAPVADSHYLKNGQFRFRLELIIHNVRKVHFPYYDFEKKTPSHNAIVRIEDKHSQVHRFYVNKEYLSMHSEAIATMFGNPNFVEGRTSEVSFGNNVDTKVFHEFLNLIYPSRKRPQVKYLRGLLEFARMYFIPMVTAVCEQRLLVTSDAEMSVGERLKLADQYGLCQVKSNIMHRIDIDNKQDIDMNKLDGLTQETLQMILRKQAQQKKYQRKRKTPGGKKDAKDKGDDKTDEAMEVDQPSTSTRRTSRRPQPRSHRARPGLGHRGGARR